LQRRSFYWLCPVAIACLLPSRFIETPYFIVPAPLFMLAGKRESSPIDLLTLARCAPAAAFPYYRINPADVMMQPPQDGPPAISRHRVSRIIGQHRPAPEGKS